MWRMLKIILGQHQGQTPFSSAFWVQKDFMSKIFFWSESFLASKSWVRKNFESEKKLGTKIIFDQQNFG